MFAIPSNFIDALIVTGTSCLVRFANRLHSAGSFVGIQYHTRRTSAQVIMRYGNETNVRAATVIETALVLRAGENSSCRNDIHICHIIGNTKRHSLVTGYFILLVGPMQPIRVLQGPEDISSEHSEAHGSLEPRTEDPSVDALNGNALDASGTLIGPNDTLHFSIECQRDSRTVKIINNMLPPAATGHEQFVDVILFLRFENDIHQSVLGNHDNIPGFLHKVENRSLPRFHTVYLDASMLRVRPVQIIAVIIEIHSTDVLVIDVDYMTDLVVNGIVTKYRIGELIVGEYRSGYGIVNDVSYALQSVTLRYLRSSQNCVIVIDESFSSCYDEMLLLVYSFAGVLVVAQFLVRSASAGVRSVNGQETELTAWLGVARIRYLGFQHRMIYVYSVNCIHFSDDCCTIFSREFVNRLYTLRLPVAPVQFVLEYRYGVRMNGGRSQNLPSIGTVEFHRLYRLLFCIDPVESPVWIIDRETVRPYQIFRDQSPAQFSVHSGYRYVRFNPEIAPVHLAVHRIQSQTARHIHLFVYYHRAVGAIVFAYANVFPQAVREIHVAGYPIDRYFLRQSKT